MDAVTRAREARTRSDSSPTASLSQESPNAFSAVGNPRKRLGYSAIKQVASGRFGVTAHYLTSARELEIKMAQGSKPGEGGQIPGHKVSLEIADLRRSVPGIPLISPPPHHDIYSIEDLAQLIHDLKRVNPRARVGVKLVSIAGVGTVAAGVVKAQADYVQISGDSGGTGASPLSSIKHAGMPWELGLVEAQRRLVENDLRGRVTLRVDGGLKTGRDVVIAALLGAEEFCFGTVPLIALGCVMARQCHLDTCPVGVATQREDLRKKFPGTPDHVMAFLLFVAEQVRHILAEMGVRRLQDVVGRNDLLERRDLVDSDDLPHLDLSTFFRHEANTDPKSVVRRSRQLYNPLPERDPLDDRVWRDALLALDEGRDHVAEYEIRNRDRSVGARLAGEVARRTEGQGLPEGRLGLLFRGVAGQSFGVFAEAGMRLELVGEAQDTVGKGMSGGEVVLRPPEGFRGRDDRAVIAGNTLLYGATGGRLFAAGRVGERFCVRNSGAQAVVEGCGDHGCEYMTAGVVVILGPTGRNFAAGMNGGTALVYDPHGDLPRHLHDGSVVTAAVGAEEEELLRDLLSHHVQVTGSPQAQEILDRWAESLPSFRKVVPRVAPNGTTLDDNSDDLLGNGTTGRGAQTAA